MMQTVYIETTVIGNIAGRLHSDPLVQARQTVTRKWWETATLRYELRISDLVIDECLGGDPAAADERLAVVDGIPALETPETAKSLADALISGNAVPASEPRDATHIAIAAVNGVELLATWNFKHILNPTLQHLIDAICRDSGFEPATICTPEQSLAIFDDS